MEKYSGFGLRYINTWKTLNESETRVGNYAEDIWRALSGACVPSKLQGGNL